MKTQNEWGQVWAELGAGQTHTHLQDSGPGAGHPMWCSPQYWWSNLYKAKDKTLFFDVDSFLKNHFLLLLLKTAWRKISKRPLKECLKTSKRPDKFWPTDRTKEHSWAPASKPCVLVSFIRCKKYWFCCISKRLTNLSELGRLGRLGYNEANFLLIVIHQWAPLAVTRFSENWISSGIKGDRNIKY